MKLLDIIFPKKCIYCGKQEGYICSSCLSFFKKEIKIIKYTQKYFDYLVYFAQYKGGLRKKLLKFKFNNNAYLAEFFIKIILENQKICEFFKNFDYIVPVPMTNFAKSRRGYNQTELLAKHLSNGLGIPVKICIKKNRENKVQSKLSGNKRFENVKGIFEIKESLENKKIILVDDIFTTGATMFECSKELKKAKANVVCGLVIAKT